MLRPQGYVTIFEPDRKQQEYDTITCCHCQRVVLVKPNTLARVYLFPQLDGRVLEEMGAACAKCGKPVCLQCHDIGTCVPAEQMLLFMEAVGKNK